MKRFIVIALLAAALTGCDDLPFHDEGHFPGRGHGWGHGHGHGDDFAGKQDNAHGY